MLVDDVFSIFPLQSNGTLPAQLTAGGIHGQNILLTRAKFMQFSKKRCSQWLWSRGLLRIEYGVPNWR